MNITPDQIESLIISEIDGDITERELATLRQILSSDPAAQATYDELKARLTAPQAVANRKTILASLTPEAIRNLKPARTAFIPRLWMAAAAVVTLAVGLSVFWMRDRPNTATAKGQASQKEVMLTLPDGKVVSLDKSDSVIASGGVQITHNNNTLSFTTAKATAKGTIQVPNGRFFDLALPDGSTVKVNSASKLTFPYAFSGGKREVWVEGEAYFTIAANSALPFIVHLPVSEIGVLGTEFNVNTYDGTEQVSLQSGKVVVAGHSNKIVLSPGYQTYTTPTGVLEQREFSRTAVLSWKEGIFNFDASLADLVGPIKRWYGIELVLDSRVKNIHFFGIIDRNQPVERFLERLKTTDKINYTISHNQVFIQ